MSDEFYKKHLICLQTWMKVRHQCRTVTAYSDLMGVSQSTADVWHNQPESKVPAQVLMLTELVTGMKIELLSPFNELRNLVMRIWQLSGNPSLEAQVELHHRLFQYFKKTTRSDKGMTLFAKLWEQRSCHIQEP